MNSGAGRCGAVAKLVDLIDEIEVALLDRVEGIRPFSFRYDLDRPVFTDPRDEVLAALVLPWTTVVFGPFSKEYPMRLHIVPSGAIAVPSAHRLSRMFLRDTPTAIKEAFLLRAPDFVEKFLAQLHEYTDIERMERAIVHGQQVLAGMQGEHHARS